MKQTPFLVPFLAAHEKIPLAPVTAAGAQFPVYCGVQALNFLNYLQPNASMYSWTTTIPPLPMSAPAAAMLRASCPYSPPDETSSPLNPNGKVPVYSADLCAMTLQVLAFGTSTSLVFSERNLLNDFACRHPTKHSSDSPAIRCLAVNVDKDIVLPQLQRASRLFLSSTRPMSCLAGLPDDTHTLVQEIIDTEDVMDLKTQAKFMYAWLFSKRKVPHTHTLFFPPPTASCTPPSSYSQILVTSESAPGAELFAVCLVTCYSEGEDSVNSEYFGCHFKDQLLGHPQALVCRRQRYDRWRGREAQHSRPVSACSMTILTSERPSP
jgi:hypothetical protein